MPTASASCEPRPASRVLILESTGHWASWLHDAWPQGGPRIHELRSIAEVSDMLREAPASIIAIEFLPETWESRCHAALNWMRQYGHVRILALSCVELAVADPLLREIGAADVAYSQAEMPRLARIILRHVRQFPSADRTLCQQWLDRIPWASTNQQELGYSP